LPFHGIEYQQKQELNDNSDYNGFGGNNNTPDKLLFFTSKRFGNIACGFNHRSVNGNVDCALKGRSMINPICFSSRAPSGRKKNYYH